MTWSPMNEGNENSYLLSGLNVIVKGEVFNGFL